MSEVVDVAVIGGGMSGLAAAYELSRRGLSFLVFEAAARPGGVVLSEQVDGFTIDAGPDSLLIQKPDAIKLCEELGLGDRLVTTKLPRIAYIQRDGRLHPLPAGSVLGIPTTPGPFLRTRLFSWPGKVRMGAELFVGAKTDDSDESIGAFMTRRFGREATEYLAEPLLAGIHAGDVDRLSMKSLFPRFIDAERKHGSLLRAFRQSTIHNPQSTIQSTIPNPQSTIAEGAFKSLPGGLSELVCALVKRLGSGTIRLSAPVDAVEGPGPFSVRSSDGTAVDVRAVVLATPAFVTGALLRARDAALGRLCDEVPYASVATVALAYPRRAVGHPLNGSGFVVPRVEKTGILAGSWLSSKWPHRAPDDRVLMRTFIGGARDPRALERDDRELVSLSVNALGPLVGMTGDPILTRVYRFPRANAQHEVGHAARMAAIDAALTRHPGVFVTGSGFRGAGIPDCVADGRKTAEGVDGYLKLELRSEN